MRGRSFNLAKVLLVVFALFSVLPAVLPAAAENEREQITMYVNPETKEAVWGEKYRVEVSVHTKVPANVSLSYVFDDNGLVIEPKTVSNVVLKQGETKCFEFYITVEHKTFGNKTVAFYLASNITNIERKHTVKILLARNIWFNLSKALANQNVSIIISFDEDYMESFSINGIVNETGILHISKKIPALNTSCRLRAVLKNSIGSFLVNELEGRLENLLNITVVPKYLVNVTVQVYARDGRCLNVRNLVANMTVNSKSILLDLSREKIPLLGASEGNESVTVRLDLYYNETNKRKIYFLNSTSFNISRSSIYVMGKTFDLPYLSLPLNITIPVTTLRFYLCDLLEHTLTSGVVSANIVLPLVYEAEQGLFKKKEVKPGENVTIIEEYNNTKTAMNITLGFAGSSFECSSGDRRGEVKLVNSTTFRCENVDAKLIFREDSVKICVNTTSRPLSGKIYFVDPLHRITYQGILRVPGLRKSANGTLVLKLFTVPFNVSFSCVNKPGENACEGEVFLWPLALWPQPVQKLSGELWVDEEKYRLETGPAEVYTGTWLFALIAAMFMTLIIAVLAKRPVPRIEERLEEYDEYYELG